MSMYSSNDTSFNAIYNYFNASIRTFLLVGVFKARFRIPVEIRVHCVEHNYSFLFLLVHLIKLYKNKILLVHVRKYTRTRSTHNMDRNVIASRIRY